jgi:hypothetical protein
MGQGGPKAAGGERDGKPGDSLRKTIQRMRQIVANSADTLFLSNGPPHPDEQLLELCSNALHHLVMAADAADLQTAPAESGTWDATQQRLIAHHKHRAHALRLMRRAKKIRARTAAGIYAKALCIRVSHTAAAEFAISLAEDLIANETLRRSLWRDES